MTISVKTRLAAAPYWNGRLAAAVLLVLLRSLIASFLYLASFTWLPLPGFLYLASFTWLPLPGFLFLAALLLGLPESILRLAARVLANGHCNGRQRVPWASTGK
jgi:hypothetical protein